MVLFSDIIMYILILFISSHLVHPFCSSLLVSFWDITSSWFITTLLLSSPSLCKLQILSTHQSHTDPRETEGEEKQSRKSL